MHISKLLNEDAYFPRKKNGFNLFFPDQCYMEFNVGHGFLDKTQNIHLLTYRKYTSRKSTFEKKI